MRILAALLLLSACSHTQVSINNGRSSISSGAQVQTRGGLAAAILAGMLVSAAAEDAPDPPTLAADRQIDEQDCTKPIDVTGNLRCR